MPNKASQFLGEVKIEMGKVSWSTRKELLNATWLVIIATFILSIYIGIVDFIIARMINLVIR
ncbi:MAG: preprotein translocase subunit SecE [Candidatus Omnitrophota bacterium]